MTADGPCISPLAQELSVAAAGVSIAVAALASPTSCPGEGVSALRSIVRLPLS
jgi:hypothetical protein